MASPERNNIVFLGGFMSSRRNNQMVVEALAAYDPEADIDSLTFSEQMTRPERVHAAVQRARVVTHSAGMLSLKGSSPSSIEAFSPPLPGSLSELIFIKTPKKSARVHRVMEDQSGVRKAEMSSTRELLAHPIANLRHLPKIARFDAVDMAVAAQSEGIDTGLTYHDDDVYFQLSDSAEGRAVRSGVRVTRLPGEHDALPLMPEATLAAYFEANQFSE